MRSAIDTFVCYTVVNTNRIEFGSLGQHATAAPIWLQPFVSCREDASGSHEEGGKPWLTFATADSEANGEFGVACKEESVTAILAADASSQMQSQGAVDS